MLTVLEISTIEWDYSCLMKNLKFIIFYRHDYLLLCFNSTEGSKREKENIIFVLKMS